MYGSDEPDVTLPSFLFGVNFGCRFYGEWECDFTYFEEKGNGKKKKRKEKKDAADLYFIFLNLVFSRSISLACHAISVLQLVYIIDFTTKTGLN